MVYFDSFGEKINHLFTADKNFFHEFASKKTEFLGIEIKTNF